LIKPELTHINDRSSNVIWIDFRRGRLSIDDDLYLKNVAEIHCRQCKHRKPREDARELTNTWGYICRDCKINMRPMNHPPSIANEKFIISEKSRQAEPAG
jgi:hypothetical protein